VLGTQLAREVEGAGIIVRPGHPASMAEAIVTLMDDSALCANLGGAAAQRARNHWGKDQILQAFEAELKNLIVRRAP